MGTSTPPPQLHLYAIDDQDPNLYGVAVHHILAYSVEDAFTLLGIPAEERERYRGESTPAVRGATFMTLYVE